jgi:MFS family permease
MTTPVSAERRTVALLAIAQALFQTTSVMLVTVSAIIGLLLAPKASLATLPTALYTVAAAATMIPASMLMQRLGRRAGFMLGAALGGAAGLIAAWSILAQSFWLFVLASMLVGSYQGFAQYYRFAAAEAASDAFRSRAISWVIAAGVVAAIAGPNLVRLTQNLGATQFVAPFLVIFVLGLAALRVVAGLKPGVPAASQTPTGAARPLSVILRQPVFLTALAGSTVGFAVMIMVMTATPLAMQMCGHSLGASASVIQWHVLGMFVPSFFTGELIRRFGVLAVMAAGALILAGHVTIALAGIEYLHFLSGLILLGVGWNFLFIGGTTLLTEAYQPAERARTQAAHDFLMFAVASIASFSAGGLLDIWGWQAVNWTVLPFLVLALGAIGGLAISRRRAARN